MTQHTAASTRWRAVVAVGCVLACAIAPLASARARPKVPPVCKLVTDPVDRSDSPSIDIVSADVATNAKSLTWVVRVTNLSAPADAKTAMGRSWSFVFKVGGKQITTKVLSGTFGLRDGSGNGATVKLDPARNEVRYTVPLASLKQNYGVTIVPGTLLREFASTSEGVLQLPAEAALDTPLPDGDTTDVSRRTYAAGKRSCVTVG